MTKTYASLIYLAIRYDKNEGWTTWLDNFKTKPPEISKETISMFNNPAFSVWNPKKEGFDFEGVFDRFNITDHREELEKFMKSWNGVGDATEAYRQHLIDADKTTSSFGKKAGNVFKSLTAGLLSIGIDMAAGMIVDGLMKGIEYFTKADARAAEEAAEQFEKTNEILEEQKGKVESLNSLMNEYSELQLSNKWDNTPLEEKKRLQEEINALLDDEAGKIDIINSKTVDGLKNLYQKYLIEKGDEVDTVRQGDGSLVLLYFFNKPFTYAR